MARDVRLTFTTGKTLYLLIWEPSTGKIWYPTDSVFETHGTSGRTNLDYAVTVTEQQVGYYYADWPSGISRGNYDRDIRLQAGATPIDGDISISSVTQYWTGVTTAEEPETNALNICNRAIAKLPGGVEGLIEISAIGDGQGGTSDRCDLLYTPARKEVLTRMQPQEVLYYADLGAESSFSGAKCDWDYVFDLPTGSPLYLLHVVKQTDEQYHRMDYNHEVMQNQLFTNIYSNEDGDSAYILYVKNETDGSVFSEETVEAIATKLAGLLAPQTLGGLDGLKVGDQILKRFEELVLPTAQGINRRQQYHDEDERESKYSWLGDRQFEDI